MSTIYLLFNEGYNAAHADSPINRDLADEALRLGRMLAAHPVGDDPAVFAMLAVIGLHSARSDARLTGSGSIILLGDQDRSAWDWALIRESMGWMARSASGDAISRYHVEAAIAWEHCRAPTFDATDWGRIASMYEILERIAPSPIHVLNLAVAEAHLDGPRAGLSRLAAVPSDQIPARYPAWPAVEGELHFRAGDLASAARAWSLALDLGPARGDRELIVRRLADCRTLMEG